MQQEEQIFHGREQEGSNVQLAQLAREHHEYISYSNFRSRFEETLASRLRSRYAVPVITRKSRLKK